MYKIILYPLSFFSVLYLIFLYNWHYNYDLFYYMPTKSMMPTLQVGDQFFVRVNYYEDNPVKRGDIIVFKNKKNIDDIKRVIGLPGDTVKVISGRVILNGKMINYESAGIFSYDDDGFKYECKKYIEKITSNKTYNIIDCDDYAEADLNLETLVVPQNSYYVLGDNRDNSLDSRFDEVGFISKSDIMHKVFFIYWSFVKKYSRMGIFVK